MDLPNNRQFMIEIGVPFECNTSEVHLYMKFTMHVSNRLVALLCCSSVGFVSDRATGPIPKLQTFVSPPMAVQ